MPKLFTKEELEENLQPIAKKVEKKYCDKGQDIVHVILPWLDDSNDCIEVYITRDENGKIDFSFE